MYNLELDKFENTNIIEDSLDEEKKLEAILEDIKSSKEEVEDISEEERKKIEAELRKLGYM